jgi:hypothetical protein
VPANMRQHGAPAFCAEIEGQIVSVHVSEYSPALSSVSYRAHLGGSLPRLDL